MIPQVSFLVLCFNHGAFVRRCLDSVVEQGMCPEAEIIVLDNDSGDNSAEVIRAWAAESGVPVRLLLEKTKRGICANLNRLLAEAQGTYVAAISADDYWLPTKTQQQIAALERLGPRYAVAYGDALRINEYGEPIEGNFLAHYGLEGVPPSGDILVDLVRRPFIPAMSTLIRRQALAHVGPYDEALIYEDYDMWLRLAQDFHFHFEPGPCCAYRILSTSLINTAASQDKPEKLWSDALIMTKVGRCDRLPESVRKNLRRRVFSLATRFAASRAGEAQRLAELRGLSGLPALALLEAGLRAGQTLSAEGWWDVLRQARGLGFFTAAQLKELPRDLGDVASSPVWTQAHEPDWHAAWHQAAAAVRSSRLTDSR